MSILKPLLWEGKETLAMTGECVSAKKEGHDCYGAIGKYESGPKEFVALRDWLNDAIAYHKKCGCKELLGVERSTDRKVKLSP